MTVQRYCKLFKKTKKMGSPPTSSTIMYTEQNKSRPHILCKLISEWRNRSVFWCLRWQSSKILTKFLVCTEMRSFLLPPPENDPGLRVAEADKRNGDAEIFSVLSILQSPEAGRIWRCGLETVYDARGIVARSVLLFERAPFPWTRENLVLSPIAARPGESTRKKKDYYYLYVSHLPH